MAGMSIAAQWGKELKGPELDELCVNTLRTLAMDAVQKANSGHPGLPMGCADFAHVLWTQFLKVNPDKPDWPDRDRFVLSAGHGSMLLYGLLHLSGFDLPLEELENFRQWGSRTPGHPEFRHAPGVECTTGPLGQGIANAVGMAIAEQWLGTQFNTPERRLVDHFTYVLCGDGDLMEGVSGEASSLAGHLGLSKLIVFYDSNHITIDGSTEITFTENVRGRYEAYGWNVLEVDGHDREAIATAIGAARKEKSKPSLIIGRTTIAYGSPNKAGSAGAHGAPLGADEVRLTKKNLGWPEDESFLVPDAVRTAYAAVGERGRKAQATWDHTLDDMRKNDPDKARLWDAFWLGEPPERIRTAIPEFEPGKAVATRKSAGETLKALMEAMPNLLGGSADLAGSNCVEFPQYGEFSRENRAGRTIHFGVREHAMGAIQNGLAYHGGVRSFGATFLVFSDYMRPAIRLAALSGLNPVYVFTHDSIYVGEDGPTHQPIEHLAALRAIPNLAVIRPAEAGEAAQAWIAALERTGGPTALCLTRQNLKTIDPKALNPASGLHKGAYVLQGPDEGLTLLASGSEVTLALEVSDLLKAKGVTARVVSMPSFELFRAQPEGYRKQVLGRSPRVAIEAGIRQGWDEWLGEGGLFIGLDAFGASAPGEVVAAKLGLAAGPIVEERILPWLEGKAD
jgi:transketolase